MKKILMSLLLIVFYGMNAETLKIYPSDDIYVDAEHDETIATNELWVTNFSPSGHFERIQIKFNLGSINSSDIQSATLKLNRFFGCPSGGNTMCKFYNITQPWNENTWDTHTHIGYNEDVSYASYNFNQNGVHSINLTELVKIWADESSNNYGLLIKALSGSKFSKFYSNNYPNKAKRPYLEIECVIQGVNETPVKNISLLRNYPNPFNPTTTINYSIPENMTGSNFILIRNLKGEVVSKYILNNNKGSVQFSATKMVSGVYYASIKSGNKVIASRKMLMIK